MSLPGQTLISGADIQSRVRELGQEISDYYGAGPVTIIGLMNGALFFLVDLLRAISFENEVECWRVTSYQGTESSGRLRGLSHYKKSLKKQRVLLVDDILDTGTTLFEVCEHLRELGAEEIKVCVLLNKKRKRLHPVKADWQGFEINDQFVIGYGLDLDGRYRSLPMIRILG